MASKIFLDQVDGLTAALADKADGVATTAALAAKADTSALSAKADTSAVTASLATKADAAYTWAASQASTSGTAFDFTGIPATANEIVVFLDEISLGGTDRFWLQLGTSGGVEATGYLGGNTTTALDMWGNGSGNTFTGVVTLRKFTGNRWLCSGAVIKNDGTPQAVAGSKTLAGVLDRVRITRSGVNTFDAGAICVGWR